MKFVDTNPGPTNKAGILTYLALLDPIQYQYIPCIRALTNNAAGNKG
jgi:hypothetical protein